MFQIILEGKFGEEKFIYTKIITIHYVFSMIEI